MPSLKDVEMQIKAVKKTKQITKAMNMVASAKLRGAQARIERFGPYADKFYEMLGDLAAGADQSGHPLLEVREEIKTVVILLVTSDKGLCGSFNTNLINSSLKLARAKAAEGKEVKFYCVGKKGAATIRRSEFEVATALTDSMSNFDFTLANRLGMEIIGAYLRGEMDEVHIVYGHFVNIAKQTPELLQILPIQGHDAPEGEVAKGVSGDYTYEPSVEGLLVELLPRFIKVQIYRGLLDTSASEHAARMAAMDNATRNCDDMVDTLTLEYNKARQAAITKELMDIVGGAEALKG